jgi:rSAM/selenodomain-associated transferase 2
MVSVIIPTLNEESCLGQSLADLQAHRAHEVLVVDGGSTDRTCRIAIDFARVLESPPGRAWQMNHGARHASGDILLFLHADCTLEPGALDDAVTALKHRDIAAACFRMAIRAPHLFYRSIEACATARVRLSGIAYGDQGIVVRRDLFHQLGGFPQLHLMEDLFFSLKLRRQGRVVVLPRRIFVSPRRWQRVGIVRQTLRNWLLTALAAGGVHPDRLARLYPAIR